MAQGYHSRLAPAHGGCGAPMAALAGWSISVKAQAESDGGQYGGSLGSGICTGCHSAGVDYVRSPFPFQ